MFIYLCNMHANTAFWLMLLSIAWLNCFICVFRIRSVVFLYVYCTAINNLVVEEFLICFFLSSCWTSSIMSNNVSGSGVVSESQVHAISSNVLYQLVTTLNIKESNFILGRKDNTILYICHVYFYFRF